MPRSPLRLAALLLPSLLGLLAAPPAIADDGDPAGWSVRTDPRRRAFLIVTERAGGPRLLTFACLRDADSFAVYAAGLPDLPPDAGHIGLVLRVADAEWPIYGSTGTDPDGGGTMFSSEWDLDAGERKRLAAGLLPVLRAPGPVAVTIGDAPTIEIPLEALPPRAGIAKPLKTFESVCFGK